MAVADVVVDRHRWVAYELVHDHPGALRAVTPAVAVRLARDFADWGSVDAFGTILAGPAWRVGGVDDAAVASWAASTSRWWRRAALVCTVALNVPARGGTGDAGRTLAVCAMLAGDPDDMVIKAQSWALRELVRWDAAAPSSHSYHSIATARSRTLTRTCVRRGVSIFIPYDSHDADRRGCDPGRTQFGRAVLAKINPPDLAAIRMPGVLNWLTRSAPWT